MSCYNYYINVFFFFIFFFFILFYFLGGIYYRVQFVIHIHTPHKKLLKKK